MITYTLLAYAAYQVKANTAGSENEARGSEEEKKEEERKRKKGGRGVGRNKKQNTNI